MYSIPWVGSIYRWKPSGEKVEAACFQTFGFLGWRRKDQSSKKLKECWELDSFDRQSSAVTRWLWKTALQCRWASLTGHWELGEGVFTWAFHDLQNLQSPLLYHPAVQGPAKQQSLPWPAVGLACFLTKFLYITWAVGAFLFSFSAFHGLVCIGLCVTFSSPSSCWVIAPWDLSSSWDGEMFGGVEMLLMMPQVSSPGGCSVWGHPLPQGSSSYGQLTWAHCQPVLPCPCIFAHGAC